MAPPRLLSKLTAVTLTAMAALATVKQAHADPDKVAYELAERCSASAEEFFASLGYPNSELNRSSYENHYNPTLNSCFMLVERQLTDRVKQTITVIRTIWNVNENRQIDLLDCGASFKDLDTPGNLNSDCVAGNFSAPGYQQFANSMRLYMER